MAIFPSQIEAEAASGADSLSIRPECLIEATARAEMAERRITELEQFAKDIAAKLDIPYEPPVAKGECKYLVAIEGLKEQLAEANSEQRRRSQWLPSSGPMTENEFRLLFSESVCESDFPLVDDDGEFTTEAIDRLTNIAECTAERLFAERDAAVKRAEAAELRFKVRCQQADECDSEISDHFTLVANAEREARARATELEAQLATATRERNEAIKRAGDYAERLTQAIDRLQAADARAESKDKEWLIAYHKWHEAEARAADLGSINGQLQGLIRTAREELNGLLMDEDLDDEKLRAASEELLPNMVDRFAAAVEADGKGEG